MAFGYMIMELFRKIEGVFASEPSYQPEVIDSRIF